jgi:peptidyl-prolyl cis-trans isomerase B (cyclophilin B)
MTVRVPASWRFRVLPSASVHSRIRALATLMVVASALLMPGAVPALHAQTASPLIVVETTRGTFAFDTFKKDAPLSVTHIVGLVKAGFYDGQRIHRALPGFLVQFGDPQTRDLEQRELWGRGAAASSGQPIGLVEMPLRRRNVAMAVGLAHMGEPAKADSQLYILVEPHTELDGQYAVIGQVIEGEDVLMRLQVGDEIRRAYVRE